MVPVLFTEVFTPKSSKITDGVMLGKMVGTNLTGVEAYELPAIKFYTPEGVESLPASFLSDEVGGGLDDLRNVLLYSIDQLKYYSYCMSHF